MDFAVFIILWFAITILLMIIVCNRIKKRSFLGYRSYLIDSEIDCFIILCWSIVLLLMIYAIFILSDSYSVVKKEEIATYDEISIKSSDDIVVSYRGNDGERINLKVQEVNVSNLESNTLYKGTLKRGFYLHTNLKDIYFVTCSSHLNHK